MTATASLDQGRAAFERQAWGNAYQQLTAADHEATLEPEDLERLAIAAHLVGRNAETPTPGRGRITRSWLAARPRGRRGARSGSVERPSDRPPSLPRNLSLDELRKKDERFLPAKIASLWWDGRGYPFLDYVHLGAAEDLLQRYRRFHFSG